MRPVLDSVFQDAAAFVVASSALFALFRWGVRGVVKNEMAENSKDTKAVLEQVRNSHSSNLREDLDMLSKDVAEIAKSMLRTERIMFLKLDAAARAAAAAARLSEDNQALLTRHLERVASGSGSEELSPTEESTPTERHQHE